MMAAANTTPLASMATMVSNSTKARLAGRPGPLTPLTGRRLESQDGELSAAT